MKKLALVTYTRKTESFTKELTELGNFLNKEFGDFKFILFSEGNPKIPKEAEFEVEQIHMEGTKYKKIKYLIENDDSMYYVSVDNDITGELSNIRHFTKKMLEGNYDVGWGKIMAKPKKNFISKLVGVDKLLSHNIIRPMLWKIGQGISIPGQYFMIKRETFSGKLLNVDTFLDDLALGLYVNKNSKNLKIYMSKKVLGQEEPNSSFKGLWTQRGRWAKGYSTIINGVNDKVDKRLVLIHGIAYHALWILSWIITVATFICSPILCLAYILLLAFLISSGNIKLFLYSIIYQFIFPIFHIRWMSCLNLLGCYEKIA